MEKIIYLNQILLMMIQMNMKVIMNFKLKKIKN